MFQIKTMNKISPFGLERLPADAYAVSDDCAAPDGILVRSASLHETELPESLLAIARAGAGVNNIPLDKCSEAGVVVFNTPGANSNAVKELVLAGLVLAGRRVTDGAAWAESLKAEGDAVGKLVEKGKSQFAGPELAGKTLGVVGLGAIGVKVANMATHLDMQVLGYDPYISIDAAWNLSRNVRHCMTLAEMLPQCDYITLHLPSTPQTRGMIGAENLALMKDGVRVLNFARGDLADNAAVLAALESGKMSAYVTDFPSAELLGVKGCVCLPHLGASTPESEDNCATMAADELRDYLENGNITNSVNFPAVSMPRSGVQRICVLHKNTPGMLAQITELLGSAGVNIENLVNKSRKEYAYTMLDIDSAAPQDAAAKLSAMESVVRVRII